MTVPAPHFLLYAEAAPAVASVGSARIATEGAPSSASDYGEGGRWRFVLRLPGGETSLEAGDDEPAATAERLELLAVVRGLESLDQPSRVTLLTGSRYIRRGLNYGLAQWRDNDWQWERYGRLAPVKNRDLWQRLDRLLDIHALECGPARVEKADDLATPRPATRPARKSQTLKRGGRMVRIDEAHASKKRQISNHKSQANSKSRTRNAPNRRGFVHWRFANWNLFEAWTLMLGAFGISRPMSRKVSRQTRISAPQTTAR